MGDEALLILVFNFSSYLSVKNPEPEAASPEMIGARCIVPPLFS
jgi:hypothetical protein